MRKTKLKDMKNRAKKKWFRKLYSQTPDHQKQVNKYLQGKPIKGGIDNLHIDCAYNSLCSIDCPYCHIPFDNIGHVGTDGFNFEHGYQPQGMREDCLANGDNDAIFCVYDDGKYYMRTYYDKIDINITDKLNHNFRKLFAEYARTQDY